MIKLLQHGRKYERAYTCSASNVVYNFIWVACAPLASSAFDATPQHAAGTSITKNRASKLNSQGDTHPSLPRIVTRQITPCKTAGELLAVLTHHQQWLNKRHVAVAYHQLGSGTCHVPAPDVHRTLRYMESLLQRHMDHMHAAELLQCVRAYSRMGVAMPKALMRRLLQRLDAAAVSRLQQHALRHLAILSWALGVQYQMAAKEMQHSMEAYVGLHASQDGQGVCRGPKGGLKMFSEVGLPAKTPVHLPARESTTQSAIQSAIQSATHSAIQSPTKSPTHRATQAAAKTATMSAETAALSNHRQACDGQAKHSHVGQQPPATSCQIVSWVDLPIRKDTEHLDQDVGCRLLGDVVALCAARALEHPWAGRLTPWDLASLIWGVAATGRYSNRFFDVGCTLLLPLVPACNPQDMSMVLKALSSQRYYHAPLLDAMLQKLAQLHLLPPLALSQVMLAAAVLNHIHLPFLFRVKACMLVDPGCNRWIWCNLLWALSKLRVVDEQLLGKGLAMIVLPEHLAGGDCTARVPIDNCTNRSSRNSSQSNSSSSSSECDSDDNINCSNTGETSTPHSNGDNRKRGSSSVNSGGCNRINSRRSSRSDTSRSSNQHEGCLIHDRMALSQLSQIYITITALAPALAPQMREILGKDILVAMSSTMASLLPHTSKTHQDVVAVLRSLDAQPVVEYREGLLQVDIVAMWRGRKIAVEVDGPHHFMQNMPGRETGETACRSACLTALGWCLVQVREWPRLCSPEQRKKFLVDLMDKALTAEPQPPQVVRLPDV